MPPDGFGFLILRRDHVCMRDWECCYVLMLEGLIRKLSLTCTVMMQRQDM